MTQKDVDRVMLALYAVKEAGERGSLEQMKAICYCLRNRVRAGWGEYMSVLATADEIGAHDPIPMQVDENSRQYQRLLRDVDDIYFNRSSLNDYQDGSEAGTLESSLADPRHPCLYWCFTNRTIRHEFAKTIIRDPQNHANRTTMGLMMFFE